MPHNVPPHSVPPPTSDTNMANLPMMRQQQFPQVQMQQQQHNSDDMDVEMEDAMPQSNALPKEKQSLSDQLLAAIGKDEKSDNDSGRDYRDRERSREGRERRDRDRNDDFRGGRDRGRRDRRRDRDRDDRRERDRDGRHPDDDKPKMDNSKMSLTDRLRLLADGALDDRIDNRNMRDRSERSLDRSERSFDTDSRRSMDGPPSLMDLPKFPNPQERPDFRGGPDFGRGGQDMRDFSRSRNSHRGLIDEFPDPRMMPGGRFPDEFDGRLGPEAMLRPEEFDVRLGMTRDEYEREARRRAAAADDFDRERYEFELRQREMMADGFDPRQHPDHPDYDRRREFFGGPMEPGFGPPHLMGPRGPRGPPAGPEGFGPRGPGSRQGETFFTFILRFNEITYFVECKD